MKKRKHHNEDLQIYLCEDCRCIHLEAGEMNIQISSEDFLEFRDQVNEIAFDVDRNALIKDRAQFLRRHQN